MMGQVSLGLQSAVFSLRYGLDPVQFWRPSVCQSFSQSNARRSRRARNLNCLRLILRPVSSVFRRACFSSAAFLPPPHSFHFSSPVSCFCALLLMLVELGGHSKLQLF
ncbi:GM17574 [Drosophila sechellia]|uniref:GM17574 n=1 Tax=Drosophila sechellia TaxID=7238 RepID=B4IG89_DROSE|nr:GM17574 [Drosophila sechellia]